MVVATATCHRPAGCVPRPAGRLPCPHTRRVCTTGPPSSRNFRSAPWPGFSSSSSGISLRFSPAREIALENVSLGAQQVHWALPTGTATSDATSRRCPRTIETMLSISVAPRSAPARRRGWGCPCRAVRRTRSRCPVRRRARPRAVEEGDVALELTERDAQCAGVERVLFFPAQQAGPKVNLQVDTVDLGLLGDGDAPDGFAEFRVPLEVGEFAYASLADWSGTCSRRRTVRISISSKESTFPGTDVGR